VASSFAIAAAKAGTFMQATKLPLTTWLLAFYLIGQAKTGISSLRLSRHLAIWVSSTTPPRGA
jgi:hypothetical protein